MPLLTLIIYLAMIGLVVWVVTTYIPMPPAIKNLIIVVVVVVVVLYVLGLMFPGINTIHVGR